MKICVIVPTYNNHKTVIGVLERLKPVGYPVFVVNDGSTDDTAELLENYKDSLSDCRQAEKEKLSINSQLSIINYSPNRGKGHALRTGFRKAQELGFDYAVTIDSDGQHYPEDIPNLVEALKKEVESGNKKVLVVGNRKLQQENMPGGNTFANHFSNFWFMVQTWQYLPDTQTGLRIYPLHHLHGLKLLTARYEAELELLVFAAWHGVKLVSSPIRVYYPPQGERVTHFRPFWDFFRISVLNTVLCIFCVVYGWWSILGRKIIK